MSHTSFLSQIIAIVLSICLGMAVGSCSAFATGTNSNLFSSLSLTNRSSSTPVKRNPADVQPLKLNYIRDHINELVYGIEDRYLLLGSQNIDLSHTVRILDPRIVHVEVDTSHIDTSYAQCDTYPIYYVICFKADPSDQSDPNHDEKVENDIAGEGTGTFSSYYVYTDIASQCKSNEYATLTITKKGKMVTKNNAVAKNIPVFTSNGQCDPKHDPETFPSQNYYENIPGSFSWKTVTVNRTYRAAYGESGYFCFHCGKITSDGGKDHWDNSKQILEVMEDHVCTDGNRWNYVTFDNVVVRNQNPGDQVPVYIFTSN